MAVAAGFRRRQRRITRARLLRLSSPYALILPVVAAVGVILGYPLYNLVRLSFQHYGLFELIRHKGQDVGLANFSSVLHDGIFWHTLLRTVVFTVVNVALTMTIGTLVALLLTRVSAWARVLLTSGLVLVWATPVVVAVQVWNWMTNYQNGVLNYVLTELHIGNYDQHDWLGTPTSQLSMVTLLIVWGALPFVAITLYAGLSQVPQELLQAASIDGARPWRVFKDITLPILKPIFVILTSLSIIWDFQVFTQVWLLRDERPTSDYFLTGIYAFEQTFTQSDYGYGSAVAISMVLILLGVTFFYIRQMIRIGEA